MVSSPKGGHADPPLPTIKRQKTRIQTIPLSCSSPQPRPPSLTLHMMLTSPPPHCNDRDEDEGSIILSLISQLRCAPRRSPDPACSPPSPRGVTLQSRHGPLQGHLPNVRPRAQEHARAHNGLYGPSGSHLWVGVCRLVACRVGCCSAAPACTDLLTIVARFRFPEPPFCVMLCCVNHVPSPCLALTALEEDCLYYFLSYSQCRTV